MAEMDDDTIREQTLYPGEEDMLRQRLLRRIGVAGVMIMLLVGGLALFDAVYVPQPNAPKIATAPSTSVEVAPAKDVTAESQVATGVIPDESAADKKDDVTADTKDVTKDAKPADKIVSEPERTESVGAPPLRTVDKPLTKPATARPANMKSTPAPAPAPEPAREAARSQQAVAQHAPASRPLTQAAADVDRRYMVQMGVFSNVSNAEELRAKLEAAGIPSQIEARVQLGPFKSRAEAEAMQKKLTASGLDTGMLVSSKK